LIFPFVEDFVESALLFAAFGLEFGGARIASRCLLDLANNEKPDK